MGKRAEQEPAAIRLYAEGLEIPQISAELGVSENSLREWKRRAGPEWDEARAACRRGFVASFEDVGRRLRRSREVAASLAGQAGIADQGRMGLVVNELLRSLLFDLSAKVQTEGELDGEGMAATIEQLKGLSLAMQRLEQASNLSVKREAEIRKQALEEAEKKAGDAVDSATGGGSRKLTAAEFKQILKESYGA